MTPANLPPKRKGSSWKKVKVILIILGVIAIYTWTMMSIDIEWGRIIERTIKNMRIMIPKLFRPNWAILGEVSLKVFETIFIAFAGTLMASVLALSLGFLAAKNMSNIFFTTIFKRILSAIRSFPELILAILFVVAVGPNTFAGVLAIKIHSTGMHVRFIQKWLNLLTGK